MRKVKHFKRLVVQIFLVTTCIFFVLSCNNGAKAGNENDINAENNGAKLNSGADVNDAVFLLNAAEINLMQIDLGHLAQQNGMITDVKELGKQMENFYNSSFKYLIALTANKFVTFPITTRNAINVYNSLSKQTGSDFDKAYCDIMIKNHEYAIAEFEEAAIESGDAAVRQWAKSMLADLRIQLSNAVACQMKCREMKFQ